MEVVRVSRVAAVEQVLGITAFALLTAFGAQVYIFLPFTPVPITLQTFFVVLSGAFLGPVNGSLSQFLYICMGLAGFGVFTGGAGGLPVLLGPTGGYLAGFLIAPAVAGTLWKNRDSEAVTRKRRSAHFNPDFPGRFAAFILGISVIYAFGVLSLISTFGYSIHDALQKGVLPFIPGDILKAAVAGLVSYSND